MGLIPALINAGRRIFLYAAGRERLVVGLSVASLGVQAAAAIVLLPAMGSTGAAISVALGEAAVWLRLRRAVMPREGVGESEIEMLVPPARVIRT
jgi:O-antigen/teichoic acid export membrane protein